MAERSEAKSAKLRVMTKNFGPKFEIFDVKLRFMLNASLRSAISGEI
jgi:hypothetical protein